MAAPRFPVGARAPYALQYSVSSDQFDLSTVTDAVFVFRRRRGYGVEGTWTAAIKGKSSRSVDLVYVFQPGDLPEEDTILFTPRLTTTLGPGQIVAAQRSLVVFREPAPVLP